MSVPQLHFQMILAGADHNHPPPTPSNESLSSSSSSKDQLECRPCLHQLPKDNYQRSPYLCAKLRYFKDFSRMASCAFCPSARDGNAANNPPVASLVACLDSHCDYLTCAAHHELCSCKCCFLVNLSDGSMFCKACHQPAVQHIGGTGAPILAELLCSVSTTVSNSLPLAPPAITTSLLLCQGNSFSSPKTPPLSGRIPRRLQNLGNTCYINASLQCLSNCRPAVRYMRKCSTMFRQLSSSAANASTEKQQRLARVVVGFGALLSHLRPVPLSSNGSGVFACALSPAAFLREFAAANPTFRILAQQDAQEFVRLLLDKYERLHEGLKECSPTLPSDTANGSPPTQKSDTKSTVVSQTFGGHLVSNIRCANCGNVSRTTDGFLDVSLSIPPASSFPHDSSSSTPSGGGSFWDMFRWSSAPVSLEECLRTFCRSEILTGSERCVCEKCRIRTDASKSLSLQTPLPDVLVLHLKRFKYDFFSSKITTHVQFPLESLELAPYCDTESLTNNPGTVTTFRCIGVVKHIGGLGGGHYIAYVRDRHSGKWFECDDSHVREVSRETVQSTEAYMIYYQKMQPHAARVSEAKRKAQAWHQSVIYSSKSSSGDSPIAGSPPSEPYVYVWADAYNALLTMAELPRVAVAPSPCPHGITHVPQTERDKLIPLPLSAWRLFSALTTAATPPAYTLGKCAECEKSRVESTTRRQAERERINSLDRGYLKPGEVWYIISANWLRLWHDYVLDTSGSVASPGPISNATDLLLSDLRTPKPKLQKSEDYRGIVKAVWDQFVGIYGGGPAIVRRTLDLYATDELKR